MRSIMTAIHGRGLAFLLFGFALLSIAVVDAKIKNVFDLCSPQFKESQLWKPFVKDGHVGKDGAGTVSACGGDETDPRLMLKIIFPKANTSIPQLDNGSNADPISSWRSKRGAWGRAIGRMCGVAVGAALGSRFGPVVQSLGSDAFGSLGEDMGDRAGDYIYSRVFGRRRKRSDDQLVCQMINAAIVFSDTNGDHALSSDELQALGDASLEDVERLVRLKDLNGDNLIQPNEISACRWNPEIQSRVKRCDSCNEDCDEDNGDTVVIMSQ